MPSGLHNVPSLPHTQMRWLSYTWEKLPGLFCLINNAWRQQPWQQVHNNKLAKYTNITCLKMCLELKLEYCRKNQRFCDIKLFRNHVNSVIVLVHWPICCSGILWSSMTMDFSVSEFLQRLSRAVFKTGDLWYTSLRSSSLSSMSLIDASNLFISLKPTIFHQKNKLTKTGSSLKASK